jgi:hypothetical protein
MSEENTKIVELEAERDELRRQLADCSVGIAEVEARALEHAAMRFKSPDVAWVRVHLNKLAEEKRKEALLCAPR